MTTSVDPTVSSSRRTWLVLASLWAVLGTWSLSSGQLWLGVAQLVFAAVSLAAARWARVAAIVDAPLFRRK